MALPESIEPNPEVTRKALFCSLEFLSQYWPTPTAIPLVIRGASVIGFSVCNFSACLSHSFKFKCPYFRHLKSYKVGNWNISLLPPNLLLDGTIYTKS